MQGNPPLTAAQDGGLSQLTACKTSKDQNPSVVMVLQRDFAIASNCLVCSLFGEKFWQESLCVCVYIIPSKYWFHNSRLWTELVERKHTCFWIRSALAVSFQPLFLLLYRLSLHSFCFFKQY